MLALRDDLGLFETGGHQRGGPTIRLEAAVVIDHGHLERGLDGPSGLGREDVRDGFTGGEFLGAVEPGGTQRPVRQQHGLQHHARIEGIFDAHAPRAGGQDLASDLDEIIVLTLSAEDRGGTVRGVPLQHGTEVEVHPFVALGESQVLLVEFELLPADLRERGLKLLRRRVRQLARRTVTPEVRQGRDGDVIHAARSGAQLERKLDRIGELLGDTERLDGLEVIEVGGRGGLAPMRERELHAIDLGFELALEDLRIDVAAAHLHRPSRAERRAVQFGDGMAGRTFRGVFRGEVRMREESHHRAQRQDDRRPRVAAAPGLGLVGGAHELEECAGRAAIFAISLRDDDRGQQPDHGQGQRDGDPDPEDPSVKGLDLSEAPTGPGQGG